jgi:hypothetical protein
MPATSFSHSRRKGWVVHHHLAQAHLDRQHPETGGVGRRHHPGHRGEVDLQRVDAQIIQLDPPGQPFGQLLEPQQAMGRVERRPLLAGDHHQRMGFAGLSALGGQQGIGVGPRHQPVGDQHIENLGEAQPVFVGGKGGVAGHGEHRLGKTGKAGKAPPARILPSPPGFIPALTPERAQCRISPDWLRLVPKPCPLSGPRCGPRLRTTIVGPGLRATVRGIRPRPQRSQGARRRCNARRHLRATALARPEGRPTLEAPLAGARAGARASARGRVRNRGAAVEDAE